MVAFCVIAVVLPLSDKLEGEGGGVRRRDGEKLHIVHIRAAVGGVGDGSDDEECRAVDEGGVGDCRALHLADVGREVGDDSILVGALRHEFVARGNDAASCLDAEALCRRENDLCRARIGVKVHLIDARDESLWVAERRGVHIVLHGIFRDDDISGDE